jgi:cation:H+ antiporter
MSVLHVVLLLGCAMVIYLACEWFVNAVEWLGVRLRVGPLAVGTVLAAVGTALPESVVTLVAVLLGRSGHGDEIGVGAALGGPLVVGTIAYAVIGVVLLGRQRQGRRFRLRREAADRVGVLVGADRVRADRVGADRVGAARVGADRVGAARVDDRGRPDGAAGDEVPAPMREDPAPEDGVTGGLQRIDGRRLSRDQTWFLAIFVVKVGLGLIAFAIKPWLGLLFFAAYAVYFWRELSGGDDAASGEGLERLKLQPGRAAPATLAVLVQTAVTLALIFVASQLFVRQLEWAGPALGLSPVVVALLLSPIATELPEIMNAVIWVRQGKTELAAANLSGAMMIQATVPSAIGLLLTPWRFDGPLMIAAGATMASVVYLRGLFRTGRVSATRLVVAAGFYGAFAVALAVSLTG